MKSGVECEGFDEQYNKTKGNENSLRQSAQ